MLAALILAGGRGTRMGGADKAFIPLAGRPLIAHVLARLTPQLPSPPRIAISANGDLTRFAPLALPILPDPQDHPNTGPLAGILAGLIWAQASGATALLTIPVDTPCFPANLAARLTPAPAVAVWRTRQHHLCASWPVSALPALTSFLATPHPKRARDALACLPATPIPFDLETDPFLNINTPADLAAAERLFSSPGYQQGG